MRKNLLSVSAFFAAAVLIFSACKKTDEPNNSIVGSWEATSQQYSYSVNTVPPVSQSTDTTFVSGKSYMLTVKSDSTYTMVDNTVTPSSTESGKYTLIPGKIVMTSTGSTSGDTMNYTVTGNTMKVFESGSYDMSGFTATYSFTMNFNRK